MREALLRAGCQMSPWVNLIITHQPQLRPQELRLEEPSFRENVEEAPLNKIYDCARESGLFYAPFQVVALFAIKLVRNKNFVSRGAEFNFGTDPNIGPTMQPRRLVVSLGEDNLVHLFGKENHPGNIVSLSSPWYFCQSEPLYS